MRATLYNGCQTRFVLIGSRLRRVNLSRGNANMEYDRHFKFLFCTPALAAGTLEGARLQEIAGAVEKLGFEVLRARRAEEAELAIRADAAVGCMVIDWGKRGVQGKSAALIALVRA